MASLLRSNWLGGPDKTPSGLEYVTAIEYVGEFGECRLKVFAENELEFKPNWYPMSLRGYVQGAKIPDGYTVNMEGAVTKWNIRFPENGAIGFYDTKEERDSNLIGDD
jgi:hypothetical protein